MPEIVLGLLQDTSYDISGHETLRRINDNVLSITMENAVLVIRSDSPIRCEEFLSNEKLPPEVDKRLNPHQYEGNS